jgi:hypothetical protein
MFFNTGEVCVLMLIARGRSALYFQFPLHGRVIAHQITDRFLFPPWGGVRLNVKWRGGVYRL